MRKLVNLTLLGLLSVASAASADTILFSSTFDTPTTTGYDGPLNPGSNIDGTKWTVIDGIGGSTHPGSVDVINTPYTPPGYAIPDTSGPQAVDLDGTSGTYSEGAIQSESFTTVPTTVTYTLTFDLAGNPGGGDLFSTEVIAGSLDIDLTSYSTEWTAESFTFTATATSTSLIFKALAPPGQSGPDLANVEVTGPSAVLTTTIPTPASAASGAVLLGVLYAVKKNRQRKALKNLL